MLNFSWLLPGHVAGMARPRPEDAGGLREQGIGALVSLTTTPLAGFEDFEILHVPIPDMHEPTMEQIARCVEFVGRVLEADGRVAVHCTAGMGRTGTILAAVLVAGGAGPAEAIGAVRRSRPGSIETPAQEEAIYRYAAVLEQAAAGEDPP